MKKLLIGSVPEALHKRFKTYCVLKGITMSDALKAYMETACAGTIITDPATGEVTIFNTGTAVTGSSDGSV